MVKIETVEWGAFMRGEVANKPRIDKKKLVTVGMVVLAGVSLALQIPVGAEAMVSKAVMVVADPNAITATAAVAADFSSQIAAATRPIKDIIFGFAHEIYFVMMSWGGLEALIGKPQQGFSRMKASTAAYIVLFWVPWIVKQVAKVVPAMG